MEISKPDSEGEKQVTDRNSKISERSCDTQADQSEPGTEVPTESGSCHNVSSEEEPEETSDDSGIPLDRGWSWMIVVGCFIMHIFCVGGIKSFGIFFVELEERFETSSKALGFVQAVASTLMLGLGPVSNALSVRFTCRTVVMTGGLLIGTGFISTAFIPTFPWLYVTYGIMAGTGFGLSYAPCVVMVGHHFVKRRSLANGISVAGSGVGQFVLPNLVRYLLNEYSYQGCMLIIGAMMLHVCVCGALMRPLSSYKKKNKVAIVNQKEDKGLLNSSLEQNDLSGGLTEKNRLLDKRVAQLTNSNQEITGSSRSLESGPADRYSRHKNRLIDSKLRYFSEDVPELHGSKHSLDSKRQPPQRFYSVEEAAPPSPVRHRRLRHLSETKSETSLFASTGDLVIASLQNIPGSVVEVDETEEPVSKYRCCDLCRVSEAKSKSSVPLFDWQLLVNPVFLVYLCSVLIANFGYPNVFIMLASYCEELRLDKDTAALLFSLIGLSDLCGRLFFGWFSDLKFFPRRYGFLGTMAISGMLSILLPIIKYYEMLIFFCCTYGFFAGSYIALIAVVLVDCLGVEKLSSAFGFTTLSMSISLLIGPPIVGGIRDQNQSWDLSFVFSGISGILGACIVLLEPLAQRRLKALEKRKFDKELELEAVKTEETLLEKS
ncbi:monocarboxylate transporter 12-like [Haliotis asinina]|uniref:monocarboxylate transporter 12-like n=1 Tax=Haliotis asinina TaxID=109174 RepID=UPI0035325DAC